jgi:SlyX protein
MDENRLIDIETKLAHQEALIEELNLVMARQQVAMDEIQTAMKSFFKRYREFSAQESEIGPANVKPPHY